MNASDELVVLCTTRDALQAELIRRALGDVSILCHIAGSHQAGLTGILDVEVLVRADELQAAQAVLARMTTGSQYEGEMTAELFDTGSDDEAGDEEGADGEGEGGAGDD